MRDSRYLNVQIFGVKDSAATRAAERFFKERRVPIQFVDLKKKSMAPGEIRRFIDRFGLDTLLDKEGARYIDAGLKYINMPELEILKRIETEPRLLHLPLVRCGNRLAFGQDEDGWREIMGAGR